MSKSATPVAGVDSSSSGPSKVGAAESDVDLHPIAADAPEVLDRKIPSDLRQKYEIYSYKNAAVILSEVRQVEFGDICAALREFSRFFAVARDDGPFKKRATRHDGKGANC